MKIDDRLSNYMSLLNIDPQKPAARMKESGDQPVLNEGDAVNVEISATATQMTEDEARLQKLNTIRQQLVDGSYNISGKNVAEKILKILQN